MAGSKSHDAVCVDAHQPLCEMDVVAFFDGLRDRGSIEQMFEFLPDVSFYIKDRQCRWMACNAWATQSLNYRDRAEILGATEFDFFPRQIAEKIYEDDQRVMATGVRLLNRIEVIINQSGHLVWVSTNKVPLFDRGGKVVGLMGITRVISASTELPAGFQSFRAAINYIQDRLGAKIRIDDLAALSNLSTSQFRTRFRMLFHLSPREFILRTRLQTAARRLSTTRDPIIYIALDCGFSNQSYFTAQFRAFFGTSPHKYRGEADPLHGSASPRRRLHHGDSDRGDGG
jgi:AraC-like DNA-binding protein